MSKRTVSVTVPKDRLVATTDAHRLEVSHNGIIWLTGRRYDEDGVRVAGLVTDLLDEDQALALAAGLIEAVQMARATR